MILSGIMDMGFLLYSRMTVINAAREGARVATIMTEESDNAIRNARIAILGRHRAIRLGRYTDHNPG